MGLIYSSADSAQLISALRSNIQSAKETTSQLTSGSQRIVSAVDGRTLAGAAYTAGKGLFSDLIIPTISRVTNAFNQLEQDLQRYQSADGMIKGEGSYLDEDIIKRKIELKRAQKSSALTSVSTLTSQIKLANTPEMSSYIRSTQREMNRLADSLEDEIRQLQKKLEALHTFSSSTSGLFSNSLTDLKVAMQGVTVLSKTIVMNTGDYILPQGKDKSWFTEQKDIAKIEEEKFQIAKGNKKKQWVSYLSRFMYVEDPNHITPEELRFNEQYKDKLFPKEEFEGDKDLTLIIAEAIRDGIDPFTGRELDWMTKASLALFAISLVAPGKFSKGKYKAKMPSRVKVENGKVVNSTTGKIVKNNNKLPKGSEIKNKPSSTVIKNNLGNKIDITPNKNHRVVKSNPGPFDGEPNSSIDILDINGEVTTRRYYDETGRAIRDVDMTNHGNPKQHPEYPHEHKWTYDDKGKPTRK